MASLGMYQLLNRPNRGENFLSLLFSNEPNMIWGLDNLYPMSLSDDPPHLPVSFHVKLSGKLEKFKQWIMNRQIDI